MSLEELSLLSVSPLNTSTKVGETGGQTNRGQVETWGILHSCFCARMMGLFSLLYNSKRLLICEWQDDLKTLSTVINKSVF